MMTTVKLYGHLAKQFGKTFNYDIDTVGESIRALSATVPGFKQYMVDHSEPGYRVFIDNTAIMDEAELGLGINKPRVIKIVPVVQGAEGGKSIGKIILGAVLIVAAIVISVASGGYLAAAGAWLGNAGLVSMGLMGVSMIAGGISELVSSVPSANGGGKQAQNYGFANSIDTIEQGLRVPIGYGQMLCEGLVVSVRLVVEE